MGSKDYYGLLGLSADADIKEIRKAYIRISRVIHPDRFDTSRQPEDWKQANRMLSEVNEAWQTLKDPDKKLQYDRQRGYSSKAQPVYTNAAPTASTSQSYRPRPDGPDPTKGIKAGQSLYSKLPEHLREKLLKRQGESRDDQYSVITDHPTPHYLKAGSILLWVSIIVFSSLGQQWSVPVTVLFFVLNLALFGWAAKHLLWLINWHRSRLNSKLYITPLYIIDTHHDLVRWWPLTGIEAIHITNGRKYYAPGDTMLNLQYKSESVSLNIAPVQLARNCVHVLQQFRTGIDQALQSYDYDYIRRNNEFNQVPSLHPPANRALTYSAYGIPVLVALMLYGLLYSTNLGNEPQIGSRLISQMLPHHGANVTYFKSDAVAPLELQPEKYRHFLVKITDSQTRLPVMTVFVRSNQQMHVRLPDGSYNMRYAAGYNWYGPQDYFGPKGAFYRDTKTYHFSSTDNELQGHYIQLGNEARLEQGEIIRLDKAQF